MRSLAGLDQSILFFLNHLGAEGMARHVTIRLIATGLMYVLAAIALYLIWKKPDRAALLRPVLLSVIAAFLIGKTLNQVVARDRPFIAFPEEVRHIALIVRPDSFPSIHAVSAFALVGAVLFTGQAPWGYVMLALALPMIAARVAAGVHWPSDVLGGAGIGLIAAAVITVLDRRRAARPIAPDGTPQPSDDDAGA